MITKAEFEEAVSKVEHGHADAPEREQVAKSVRSMVAAIEYARQRMTNVGLEPREDGTPFERALYELVRSLPWER